MATRKTFSPEDKVEAIRLINEEGYTQQQAADHIGCSVFSVQQWRRKSAKKSRKKAKKDIAGIDLAEPMAKVKRRRRRSQKAKRRQQRGVALAPAAVKPQFAFDELVQKYWSKSADTVAVASLPPDIAPKVMQYVNNALRYAHEKLQSE